MLIVQKFGGSSVADKERVENVAKRIKESYNNGENKVVVVLSAQGDTTDILIKKAIEINENPSKREMDMLLHTGEIQSVALMAMALSKMGVPAVSLAGYQAGLLTTSTYSNARIKKLSPDRLENELENNNVVIVAGFQGINKFDDITTLGRGGSDTTAVALAAALNADVCEIYSDVIGVLSGDPRIVDNAKKLKEISYDEMLELATLGAKVLHNRSVELAKKYNVNLIVRSSMSDDEGTIVKEGSQMEKLMVSGVACDTNIARISVIGVKDEPGVAHKIFSLIAREKVAVDLIIQSIGRDNTKDITFTINRDDLPICLDTLEKNKARLTIDKIISSEDIAKISVVGAGMESNSGVASMMFEALSDADINIEMITTSEIKISVLIDKEDATKATRAVHDKFFGEN